MDADNWFQNHRLDDNYKFNLHEDFSKLKRFCKKNFKKIVIHCKKAWFDNISIA